MIPYFELLILFFYIFKEFSDWKSFSDPVAAKNDAFTAGIDSQGNRIYVGRGIWNNMLTPGRLFVETVGSNAAGLYVEFGAAERKITTNIEYYVNNPSCAYKWVVSSNGAVVANAVQVVGTKTYYIGRVYDQNTLNVGKVLPGSKLFYGNNGLGFFKTAYEVLVCEREKTVLPVISISH